MKTKWYIKSVRRDPRVGYWAVFISDSCLTPGQAWIELTLWFYAKDRKGPSVAREIVSRGPMTPKELKEILPQESQEVSHGT